MSSAAAGWYVDPSTGTNLRYWSGSTWTDEVAPLPHEPTHSGPVDLFGPAATAIPATKSEPEPQAAADPQPATDTEAQAATTEPAAASEPDEPAPDAAEPAAEPAALQDEGPAGEDQVPDAAADAIPAPPELDPEVEQTQLTRRELRARRGAHPEPDDTPKHLPPMTPPAAASVEEWSAPVEKVEIPVLPAAVPFEVETQDDPVARRRRIVRMSVLLGILAVVSSVGVLTAGSL